MKRKLLVLPLLALALSACEQREKTPPPPPPAPKSNLVGVGEDESSSTGSTVQDQNQNRLNGELARRIKDALQRDNNLSTQIRNIQIKTDGNGQVTLRGTVETDRQKETIGRLVGNIPGVKQVDNQLQAKTGNGASY